MKRRFAIMIIAVACVCATGCKEKTVKTNIPIPAEVKTAFVSKYTGAEDVVWEDAHENGENTYKAKFKMDGKEMKAEFRMDGSLVKEKVD